MNGQSILLRRSIAASGGLVFRPADGAVPAGYRAVGPVWAMVAPDGLQAAGLREGPIGLAFEKPTAVMGLREQIAAFWKRELGALLPMVPPQVPWSVAGVSGGAALTQPASGDTARSDQIAAHVAARVALRLPARGVPAFADLVMRQIAVLRLPATAEVSLYRDGTGDWVLEFHESGPMGHLFADLSWHEPDKKAKDALLECRPSATASEARGALIALARAVQLAELAVTSGLGTQDRLRVEVSHAGLGGSMLALTLRPENRGLPFARLMRLVAGNLRQRMEMLGDLQALPCTPRLVADHSAGAAPEQERLPDLAEPLRWYPQGEEAALHWVYSGDRATSGRYPSGLPFALAPYDPAVFVPQGWAHTFHSLSVPERGAYVDWLSGPRRADGFRPVFADLYCQGLEHRILAETPSAQELEALLTEIRHIRIFLDPTDALALRMAKLLDWLAATGKCATGPLAGEGPLTCLALLGRSVAQGQPLEPSDMAVLLRVSGWAEDEPGTGPAEWPSAVVLSSPAKPLVARYASLSGLCDIDRHVFRHDGIVVPDLRASARLRALLVPDAARTEGL
jgi:hypothetical protein